MPKDIRSYFTVLSKKTTSDSSTNLPKKKPKRIINDSDDEDVISATPEPKKSSKPSKRQIISSDSEDERPKKYTKKQETTEKKKESPQKLKSVNISEVFGRTPIKQSKVEPLPELKKAETEQPKTKSKRSKKDKNNSELSVHKDKDFQQTLLELDDDFLIENADILDKTIEDALNQSATETKKSPNENEAPAPETSKNSRKRSRTDSESKETSTPKKKKENKDKLEHTDSGIDPGQEAHEKRRWSAMMYQKYLHRGAPKNQGMKEYPKGKPDCLKNLCFLKTGVLDSLDGDEFQNLVKAHGGRVVHAVSKKVNYVVVGEDPGPSKVDKARGFNIPEISEDEFLDIILVKSGMKPKYCKKNEQPKSEDLGIESDDTDIIEDTPEEKPNTSNKESKKPNLNKLKEIKPKDEKVKTPVKTKDSPVKQKLDSSKQPIKKATETSPKAVKKDNSSPKKIKKDSSEVELKTEIPSSQPDDNSMSLTEKYKPIDIRGIIGQQEDNSNMNKLLRWLKNWYHNQKPEVRKKLVKPSPWSKNDNGAYFKCALLSGPPGVGKTTTATLVAKELNLDIVEFNASDTRSKRLLHQDVSQLLSTNTIAGFATGQQKTSKQRVLLMDEVDGMAGNEDRGGMQELIQLIKTTQIPIICMCNDRNHPKIRSLVNYCFDLKFAKPKLEQIRGAMMSVCFKEGKAMKPNVIAQIISGTGCDIRQTLNHLSMHFNSDKAITVEEAEKEAKTASKDTILGPWEVVRKVFTYSDHKEMSVADKARLFFYDYSLGPLFVQENYLGVQPRGASEGKQHLRRVAAAADCISMGDIIDSTIRGSNNWSLLETQAMFSSVFPGYFMSGHFTKMINFPAWLGKNSKRNKFSRILSEIQTHTRTTASANKLALKLDYLIPLRNAIVMPLKKYGLDGIEKAVDVMKTYNLLREDLDGLNELCQWKKSGDIMSGVDSKVKSAFTRNYNKNMHLLPYAPTSAVAKKKAKLKESDEAGLLDEDELVVSDVEEDDDVEKDATIKVKKNTGNSSRSKKDTEKAGTSKKKETKGSTKGRKK